MDGHPTSHGKGAPTTHVDDQRARAANTHPDRYVGQSPIRVNRLGHMVYEVSDVERTARFWSEVMGFEETDRNEIGMVFFRCGPDHHAIGLKPGKARKRPATGEALKIEHLAFEVEQVVFRHFLRAGEVADIDRRLVRDHRRVDGGHRDRGLLALRSPPGHRRGERDRRTGLQAPGECRHAAPVTGRGRHRRRA